MTGTDDTLNPQDGGGGGKRRFGKAGLRRVGQVLREHRLAQGLSLRVLAERSGISIAAIRALEAGQSNPSLGTVVPVVDVLGVRLDRVIDDARPPKGRVVVTRASESTAGDAGGEVTLSEGLADAVLSASILELPVKSMRRAPKGSAQHPSFAMVTAGQILASTDPEAQPGGTPTETSASSQRVKLVQGDNYHAQPQVVTSLANSGASAARMFVVHDRRAHKDPATS